MEHFITEHGLPLLFLAIAIESFGIPVPGETALIAFGVLASQGHYPIEAVIGVAAAAAIIGDNLGYELIGRKGGRALLERYDNRLTRYVERALPRAEAVMERHGGKTVFFGRFIAVLRYTVAWVAGISGMPWRTFLFWNAFGGIVWASAVGLIAYWGGQALADEIERDGVIAAVILGVVLLLGWLVWRRIEHRIGERL